MEQTSDLRASAGATASYRRLLLALIAAGAGGLLAELLLLEHFEPGWQWAPVASLAATLPLCGILLARPSSGVLRAFRVVMIACLVFGAIGVFLHIRSNIAFELEGAPELAGWPLYWAALEGAVPALAPGALAQLGLLGLLYAHRHPVGTESGRSRLRPDSVPTPSR